MDDPPPGLSTWEAHQREVAVLTAAGAMPATIEGGADRGAFLRIGQVLDEESGLREGDVVLEVQGKAVSGMTRLDANDWLRMCATRGGVVSFRLSDAGKSTDRSRDDTTRYERGAKRALSQ